MGQVLYPQFQNHYDPKKAKVAQAKRLREHRERQRAIKAASKRKHQALKRAPAFSDNRAIAAIYAEAARRTRETGIAHHVDHVIPLMGRLVSGLHIETNLAIIPATANQQKSNKFAPGTA